MYSIGLCMLERTMIFACPVEIAQLGSFIIFHLHLIHFVRVESEWRKRMIDYCIVYGLHTHTHILQAQRVVACEETSPKGVSLCKSVYTKGCLLITN